MHGDFFSSLFRVVVVSSSKLYERENAIEMKELYKVSEEEFKKDEFFSGL